MYVNTSRQNVYTRQLVLVEAIELTLTEYQGYTENLSTTTRIPGQVQDRNISDAVIYEDLAPSVLPYVLTDRCWFNISKRYTIDRLPPGYYKVEILEDDNRSSTVPLDSQASTGLFDTITSLFDTQIVFDPNGTNEVLASRRISVLRDRQSTIEGLTTFHKGHTFHMYISDPIIPVQFNMRGQVESNVGVSNLKFLTTLQIAMNLKFTLISSQM